MSNQDLAVRLYKVACKSLELANTNTLFVNKKQARQDVKQAKKLLTSQYMPSN